jgi:hypothetical protein
MGADLERALGTPEAGTDVCVLPRDSRTSGEVAVEQSFEGFSAGQVYR